MDDMFSLDGKLALVTGSSAGIGFVLAKALGSAGAAVLVNGRRRTPVHEAVERLQGVGITAYPLCFDVTDASAVGEAVRVAESEHGPIDILVNNAGVQRRAPFLEFTDDDWDLLVDTNLTGPFIVSRAVARSMAERGSGKIIMVCSVQSELARPSIAPYSATKGGLKMLIKGMCADLGPLGIQVNGLGPGYFDTELTKALVDDAEFSAWVAERTPAGRWGQVDELAGTVIFLSSRASDFINGQIIYVDGGMLATI